MPRNPISVPPPTAPPRGADFISLTFHITTFRYGGGVEPRLPDEITPIRVPSLRGQLRFWWRAFFAYQYPDHNALREAEGRYWGSTEGASAIKISVSNFQGLRPTIPASRSVNVQGRTRWEPEQPAYALFPAQQDLKNIGVLSPPGATFSLEVRANSDEALRHAKFALFAFANFGGYGARSRRGCGTLYCPQLTPKLDQTGLTATLAYLQKPLFSLGRLQPKTDWPSLKGSTILLGPQPMEVSKAWAEVFQLYRSFRQDRDSGSQNRPGRSKWPEPDSIRRARNTWFPHHEPRFKTGDYPRAVFGLPIVFHFKDQSEPKDQRLEPDPQEGEDAARGMRLSSPFILKPLMVSPTHAYPMVVRLHSELFRPESTLGRRLDKLLLREEKAHDLSASMGPRRADEEFLKKIESVWKTPRLVL